LNGLHARCCDERRERNPMTVHQGTDCRMGDQLLGLMEPLRYSSASFSAAEFMQ
jgi:hypothetical protein